MSLSTQPIALFSWPSFALGGLCAVCLLLAGPWVLSFWQVIGLCIGLVGISVWRFNHIRFHACLGVMFFLSLTTLHAERMLQVRWHDTPAEHKVEARISSLPAYLEQADVLKFKARFRLNGKTFNTDVRWYKPTETLNLGDTWQLTLFIKSPRATYNGAGLDIERSWLSQRLHARATVRKPLEAKKLSSPHLLSVAYMRQRVKDTLASLLKNHAMHPLIEALVLGERANMTQTHWQVLKNTGTSHLMAISGLHMGLVAAGVFFMVRGLCFWFKPTRRVATVLAALSAWLAMFAYGSLAAWTVPTQRAAAMVSLGLWAVLRRQGLFTWRNLSIAMVVVLALNVWSVLSAGFWLSFSAVGLIVLALSLLLHSKIKTYVWVQTVLFVGLLPVTWQWFSSMAFMSWWVNLWAIPIMSFLLLPAILLSSVVCVLGLDANGLGLNLAADGFNIFWKALSVAADFGQRVDVTWFGSTMLFVCVACMLLLKLLPRAWPGKALWVFLLLLSLLNIVLPREQTTSAMHVLDVGQGLAVVVQTKTHTLLFDAGMRYHNFDMGEAVVVPSLQALGIRKLDRIIISHADMDHRGGLGAVLEHYPNTPVLSSVPLDETSTTLCLKGQRWVWDGITFEMLHPSNTANGLSDNNRSCVLSITAPGMTWLLTGDIEWLAEWRLLSDLQAFDLVVAPHHGSATSSTSEFIAATRPKHVVFTVGYANRWRFPKSHIEKAWQTAGASVWRSDQHGRLTFTHDPEQGILPFASRCYTKRFGHHWPNAFWRWGACSDSIN